jgi:hypothetical protein
MKIGGIPQVLRKQLAHATRSIVHATCEQVILIAKTITERVDSSVTACTAGAVRGDRWDVDERVDDRIAVRDENGLLVAWVLPEDAALVAAAPALHDVLCEVIAMADKDPAWLPHAHCLWRARALLRDLDDGNGALHGEADEQ